MTENPAGPPALWYRDPISCLYATFATVITAHRHDPLEVLGAAWEFRHLPGDVRPEEFYHPQRRPGDLGGSLAPYHRVRSRWRTPEPGSSPLDSLARLVAGGVLPVAAVDNFHLPFRPAYHDVHAAHLVVVYGVDPHRGLVFVSDAMPPAFQGPIPAEDFLAAWGSPNLPDDEDPFFSSTGMDHRYLVIEAQAAHSLDRAGFRAALEAELAAFDRPSPTTATQPWTGLAGVRHYTGWIAEQAAAGSSRPVREVYPFGWSMQGQAALHGELLRLRAGTWDRPELREAGRAVEAVAHAWSGLRVTAAHGWADPRSAAGDLGRHGRRLVRRYEAAVELLHRAAAAL
jgi:hypothetical protein